MGFIYKGTKSKYKMYIYAYLCIYRPLSFYIHIYNF